MTRPGLHTVRSAPRTPTEARTSRIAGTSLTLAALGIKGSSSRTLKLPLVAPPLSCLVPLRRAPVAVATVGRRVLRFALHAAALLHSQPATAPSSFLLALRRASSHSCATTSSPRRSLLAQPRRCRDPTFPRHALPSHPLLGGPCTDRLRTDTPGQQAAPTAMSSGHRTSPPHPSVSPVSGFTKTTAPCLTSSSRSSTTTNPLPRRTTAPLRDTSASSSRRADDRDITAGPRSPRWGPTYGRASSTMACPALTPLGVFATTTSGDPVLATAGRGVTTTGHDVAGACTPVDPHRTGANHHFSVHSSGTSTHLCCGLQPPSVTSKAMLLDSTREHLCLTISAQSHDRR